MMRMLVAFGWLFVAPASAAVAQEPPPFDAALRAHLESVQARDLAAFEATITREPRMTLIFPDGRALRTRREVLELHRDWFASTTWTLEARLEELTESDSLGLAVIHLTYRDEPPGGDRVVERSMLTLGFARQGDRWVMIHDQNTRDQSR